MRKFERVENEEVNRVVKAEEIVKNSATMHSRILRVRN